MLSLSASQPTVSATARPCIALRLAHRLHDRLVDPLDQVVAALIQLVDVALRRGDLVIIVDASLVLFVPQLDVRLREPRDQRADRVVHRSPSLEPWGASAAAPAPRSRYSRASASIASGLTLVTQECIIPRARRAHSGQLATSPRTPAVIAMRGLHPAGSSAPKAVT